MTLQRVWWGWGVLALLVVACQPASQGARQGAPREQVLRVNIQPGYGYASLVLMQKRQMLEQRVPGLRVEWKLLTSGNVVNEALLSGNLDIGTGAPPPFLIAWSKGLRARIAAGLVEMPLGLTTHREDVQSLRDFGANDRIAVTALGSIHHVLVQMAAEKELGDARALDNSLVAMAHPDGLAALLSRKEITAHFTSPPFLFQEMESPGIHRVLDSYELMGGPHNFLVAYTTIDFHDKQPDLYRAFVDALEEATAFVNTNPAETARLLAESEGTNLPLETVQRYLTWPGTTFTTTPRGLMRFAEFMARQGTISKKPSSWQELAFENLHDRDGS